MDRQYWLGTTVAFGKLIEAAARKKMKISIIATFFPICLALVSYLLNFIWV